MKEVKTVKNMSSLIFRILEMNSDNSVSEEKHLFALFSRCLQMKASGYQWPIGVETFHWYAFPARFATTY